MNTRNALFIISIFLLLLTSVSCSGNYGVRVAVMNGESMFPFLNNGEEFYYEVVNVREKKRLLRGDVVIFSTEGIEHPFIRKEQLFVHRVVGLAGDIVSIRQPYVYVNGKRLLQPVIFRENAKGVNGASGYRLPNQRGLAPILALQNETSSVTVQDNECFLLGDNAEVSIDGRFYGSVKMDNVVGLVSQPQKTPPPSNPIGVKLSR